MFGYYNSTQNWTYISIFKSIRLFGKGKRLTLAEQLLSVCDQGRGYSKDYVTQPYSYTMQERENCLKFLSMTKVWIILRQFQISESVLNTYLYANTSGSCTNVVSWHKYNL
jgi:hypothetical protein